MKKNKEYEIDTYAYILNVDSTILKLNDWLSTYGFEFIEIDFDTLQNDFGQVVFYKTIKKPNENVNLNGCIVDKDFYTLYNQSPLYEFRILHEKLKIILFKQIDSYKLPVINNFISINTHNWGKSQKFLSDFLRKLRLFKLGNISIPIQFEISKKERNIFIRSGGHKQQIQPDLVFSISRGESKKLIQLLNKAIEPNGLNELALLNFEASYSISNPKVRFITLVTSLESLFNFGREQIAHTISRHLSLIISKSKSEFDENYTKIKKLYNKRSSIVHGSSEKVTTEDLIEIENLVRQALLFSFNNSFNSKKDLFDYLNSKGFKTVQIKV